jgi:AcrR family transcriptional regulator
LSAAALSVIGSITDHSAALAVGEIRGSVSEMATNILAAELPVSRDRPKATPRPVVTASAGIHEFVLYESMRLFYKRGFRDTSMDDIAAAVGIQPSGLYRHFPGKADILAATYRRAADRLSGDIAKIVSRTPDSEQALAALIEAYVARSFARPEIAYVYYTERHNLPAEELLMLDTIQQSTVDAWARLATAARPGLSIGRARYAVHAAYAVIVDLGRLVRHNNSAQARSTARRLTEITLLGRPAGKE